MQMWFYWGCMCRFLFEKFQVNDGQIGLFIFACCMVAIFCFLGPFLRSLKDNYIYKAKCKEEISKPLVLALQLLNFIHDAMMMLLVMTYNWGVLIAVLVGYTIGYFVFNVDYDREHSSKEVFADCC